MVDSTFQLAAGIGPTRERRLWQSGIARWRDLPESPTGGLGANHDRALRAGIEEASAALARGDADALAALLPQGERWRLFDAFGEDATYLDIETSDDVVGFEGISAIGFLNRDGPRLLLAARDLHHFPELARGWPMLVTFNGLSFDVPILRRAFPEWQPPRCHVDLRHVLARLGLHGGLKLIERRLAALSLARPAHLSRLSGWDTGWLYRRGRDGDRAALRLFAEYNLYDAINLRTLMAYAYNALVEREATEAPALRAVTHTVPVPERGDVLYDVSKILLSL
jgi:uncharacterized protein